MTTVCLRASRVTEEQSGQRTYAQRRVRDMEPELFNIIS